MRTMDFWERQREITVSAIDQRPCHKKVIMFLYCNGLSCYEPIQRTQETNLEYCLKKVHVDLIKALHLYCCYLPGSVVSQ